MIKKISLLLILLFAQIGIAAYLFTEDKRASVVDTAHLLLAIKNIGQIDKISIDASEKKFVLAKKDNQWLMPDYNDLPANDGLVLNLLNKLSKAKTGWIVAQTKSASDRFHVSPLNNKRRLVLYANGEKLYELFFGDSPGLNKIYVRRLSESAIYSIELGLHLLSIKENDWLDKNLLQVKGELSKVSGKDFELIKNSDGLRLADLKKNEKMNADEVGLLISYLEKIQVESLVDNIPDKDFPKKPDLSYLISKGDQQVRYDFFKKKEGYFVKSSQQDYYFKIAAFFYENVQKLVRKTFVK